MNVQKPVLGKGSKELLDEAGLEVIQPEIPKIVIRDSSLTSQPAAGVDPPELRAATAIPAIVEILQDVPAQYHEVIFKSVIGILKISRAEKEEIKPWEVEEKPAVSSLKQKRHWWNW